ncbi:sigma-70 family RNA polymerase sigma factor [Lachnospiraceae bacterium MD329]|nr:sigma-70 family RNA polymerase sigma factor [Lachnospiraceae bacterium MD329]
MQKKRSRKVIDYDIEWMGEDDIYPSERIIFDGKGHSCTIQTEWLYDAMLRLDDKYKSVLILKYWYGFLQKEIAEMLHVSRRTITSWNLLLRENIAAYAES